MRMVQSDHFPASLLDYAARQLLEPLEAFTLLNSAISQPLTGLELTQALPNLRLKELETRQGPQEYLLYALDIRNDALLKIEIGSFNLDAERSALSKAALFEKVSRSLTNIEKIILILE